MPGHVALGKLYQKRSLLPEVSVENRKPHRTRTDRIIKMKKGIFVLKMTFLNVRNVSRYWVNSILTFRLQTAAEPIVTFMTLLKAPASTLLTASLQAGQTILRN